MRMRGPAKHLHRCIQRELGDVSTGAMGLPKTVDGKAEFVVCARWRVGPDRNKWPFEEAVLELTMTPDEARLLAKRLLMSAQTAERLGVEQGDHDSHAV